MLYALKLGLLKRPIVHRVLRGWDRMRGRPWGSYDHLPDVIRAHAPGRSFVDVGCMWGVNGLYAFLAEEAGATSVAGIDVFGPTPEFEHEHRRRRSRVEFVLGDASSAAVAERVGVRDVVFCAGVLYHHPSPFDLLVALRRMCGGTLLLRSSTIPEVPGLPHAAVYWPYLPDRDRDRWSLRSLGLLHQEGISNPFNPGEGYSNWFWGLTPGALRALLATAGFRVEVEHPEPFARTIVATAVDVPLAPRLPDDQEARRIGRDVSRSRRARPA